jgi:NitT/TauT family transport system substrate-binding protein
MTRSLAPSLAFAAALALAADAPPASAQSLEKLSMSIASTSMNYAPYFIPIAKGYFKDEGFEIDIVKAAGGAATPALLSGQTDISTSGSAALSAILKGGQMRIIFYPWDQLTYQVWSTKPEIKTLQDMKGKAVGIQSRGDTFETSMRLVLLKHGMDPNSVSYTPLGFGDARRAAIASGSLPVAIISPQDVDELKKAGLLKNATLIYDMYKKIELPLTGTAVRAADLEQKRDRIKRFIRAVAKGHAYAAAFRDETIKIVADYNKAVSPSSIAATYDDTMTGRTDDGSISEELQKTEATIRAELIGVPKDKIPPLSKIYDFTLAKEVGRELKAQGWKPTK